MKVAVLGRFVAAQQDAQAGHLGQHQDSCGITPIPAGRAEGLPMGRGAVVDDAQPMAFVRRIAQHQLQRRIAQSPPHDQERAEKRPVLVARREIRLLPRRSGARRGRSSLQGLPGNPRAKASSRYSGKPLIMDRRWSMRTPCIPPNAATRSPDSQRVIGSRMSSRPASCSRGRAVARYGLWTEARMKRSRAWISRRPGRCGPLASVQAPSGDQTWITHAALRST